MSQPSLPDQIGIAEFQKRLVELCLRSGNRGLPRKQRDRHILLKSVTLTFDKTRQYTEPEVNRKLRHWLRDVGDSLELDHVMLRRHLVDEEFLGRNQRGSRYWVAVMSRKQVPFDPAIEELDVPELVRHGRESIQRKKQEYLRNRSG